MTSREQFPNRPRFEALLPHELEDGKSLYEFTEDWEFNSPFGPGLIPKGYRTNFASIPDLLLWFLDDDDPTILCPSCVHDHRYDEQFDKLFADVELYSNMRLCGASFFKAFVVFVAVCLGGRSHYKKAA